MPRVGVIKQEFFFDPDNLPENYEQFLLESTKKLIAKKAKERKNPYNYPVGITAYSNFFTEEELKNIEL